MRSSAIFQSVSSDSMFKMEVYIIENDILQSCTYILSKDGEAGVYLVDCGNSVPIFSYLEHNGEFVKGVFLTHAHYDHIYGLNDIIERYPDLDVYASEKTFVCLEDSDLNMSYLYTDDDFEVRVNKEHSIIVSDKSKTAIFGEIVDCIATPGHDVDCISYLIGKSLFTGDSYNPNSPVFTKWRNSDADLAIKNEAMLSRLIVEKGLSVYPGHNIKA